MTSMKKTTHREYGLWFTGGIALVLVVGYGVAVWFVSSQTARIEEQAKELQGEIRREESLRKLGGFLNDLSDEQEALRSYVVSPAETVTSIEQIEKLADVIGAPITIDGVRLEEVGNDGEGELRMIVSSEGSWKKMIQLVSLLDTLPFASIIDDVNLVAVGDEKKPQWILRASLHTMIRN